MAKLITRIGQRDDPKRTRIELEPRLGGTYFGRVEKINVTTGGAYGNSLDEALRRSFWWAGIKLYSLFDFIQDLASNIEEAEDDSV